MKYSSYRNRPPSTHSLLFAASQSRETIGLDQLFSLNEPTPYIIQTAKLRAVFGYSPRLEFGTKGVHGGGHSRYGIFQGR